MNWFKDDMTLSAREQPYEGENDILNTVEYYLFASLVDKDSAYDTLVSGLLLAHLISLLDNDNNYHPLPDHTKLVEEGFSRDNIVAVAALNKYFKLGLPVKWWRYINLQFDFVFLMATHRNLVVRILSRLFFVPMLAAAIISFYRSVKIRPAWWDRLFKRKGKYQHSHSITSSHTVHVYSNMNLHEFYRTDGKKLVLLKTIVLKESSLSFRLLYKLCNYIASNDSVLKGDIAKIYEIYYPKGHPIIAVTKDYFGK
jgi:hypothetical protein